VALGLLPVNPGAPIIRSSMPSPLMSPALLTLKPDVSEGATPLMVKPLDPVRSERLKDEIAIVKIIALNY